jgi:hypothetical protein
MGNGRLNVGRLEGKQVLKPTVGKNATSRKKMRRVVSKVRRRIAREATQTEPWLEQLEGSRERAA